ncbi:hypothetical protein FSZ31_05785 [Sphingorhabdus soli]|uniref:Glycosyltransferase RgtA/B/C/D-like domain-containing protein n=1 Tax=Flavisphingopyxis soli TaxID=2601267 RepID=A0A5C6UPY8_9SPHN|nr:hypothetical protein [Sphingorhabdus soli]TXC74216.1 hypothetical protein FSZ31_05785 [Sphingorhabdus soli]
MSTETPTTDPARTADSFISRLLLASAGALVVLVLLASLGRLPLLAHAFLVRQDIAITLTLAMLFVVFAPLIARSRDQNPLFALERRHVAIASLIVVIVCLVGFQTVLWGRDLSRDEQMAMFDARTFAAGHWIGIIPENWVGFRPALNTIFMQSGLAGSAWASDYRPINSALHAIGQLLGYAHIVGPLFGALGLWATWRCARLMWPDGSGSEAVTVSVVTLLLSAQFLLNAMTAYAMAPLLALNMVWLLLVWRDDKPSHAGALAIGFFATGLHQVLYHPLFAFPVAAVFLIQRRWGLAAIYALAYPAFILFWEMFSGLRADWASVLPMAGAAAGPATGAAGGLLDQARNLAGEFGWGSVTIQAANLVRLLSWQHIAFLPLLIAGGVRAWRTRDTRLLTLVAIIVLTIAIKLVLRPYQGHGWGYRYLHGALGAMCLLCGAGWIELRQRGIAHARVFITLSLVTLVTIIPLRFYHAYEFAGAFARPAFAAMESGADIAIVDNLAAPFSQDIVINDPFVRNRPVMLLASGVSPAQMAALCRDYRITTVDRRDLAAVNAFFRRPLAATQPSRSDATMAAAAQCRADQRSRSASSR